MTVKYLNDTPKYMRQLVTIAQQLTNINWLLPNPDYNLPSTFLEWLLRNVEQLLLSLIFLLSLSLLFCLPHVYEFLDTQLCFDMTLMKIHFMSMLLSLWSMVFEMRKLVSEYTIKTWISQSWFKEKLKVPYLNEQTYFVIFPIYL